MSSRKQLVENLHRLPKLHKRRTYDDRSGKPETALSIADVAMRYTTLKAKG